LQTLNAHGQLLDVRKHRAP